MDRARRPPGPERLVARAVRIVARGALAGGLIAMLQATAASASTGAPASGGGSAGLPSIALGVSLAGAGGWLGWRRLARGERRESIDIEQVIAAKYPNRRARHAGVAGESSWSASAEAGLGLPGPGEVQEAGEGDEPTGQDAADALEVPTAAGDGAVGFPGRAGSEDAGETEWGAGAEHDDVVDLTGGGLVHRLAMMPALPPILPDTDPQSPLPGEPVEIRPPPVFRGHAVQMPDDGYVADPYHLLIERRDRTAAQVAEAFAELHRLRTEALRRASQAEHNAELASSARNRATRMVRDSRRRDAQRVNRASEFPDAADAFGDVHELRTEAFRRASQAEHGAESVQRARERANRLLAEQRRIETEMRKLAPRYAPE